MRIRSDSFTHGEPLPAEFALGAPDGFGGNRNPHLAWDDVPEGTRSFALMCIDTDAPTDPALVAGDVPIPVDHPRGGFVHWVVADLPAGTRSIAAGAASDGVTKQGKPAGGIDGIGGRQGLNDYTGWFAGDADMGGDYHGYDGPYPPGHDLRVHRYFFRVFALDVDSLDLPAKFTAADVFRAMHGHVLGEAAEHGTYTLNR
ncbi:MAG TPA: YbhB/YbcL family Raf kinase inhibitor-like protein [Xanthomonadaceae bacterium]|nr:YbhB/YbcL family Raf kinase inhibitor-like protein [Xanthomonadaceae bacterium]